MKVSILEIILYSLIGSSVVMYFIYKTFIKPRKQNKKKIEEEMLNYFSNPELCKGFVEMQFERKQRNLIARRVRMARKANLANFNYFCTCFI